MPPVKYHTGKFPPDKLDLSQIISLIGPANAALARYDTLLGTMQNASVLLSPLTMQEAVLSSRIEGTQATMGEVLEYEAGAGADEETEPEKVGDIREVLNYRKAMHKAEALLDELPLSGRLIRQVHEVLLDDVRGKTKTPGKYRRGQNAIGKPGCDEKSARFLPIAPEHLTDGMKTWEKYINAKKVPDPLIQLAVMHAEFESLHPFWDGNGRLGRMLIPLFLFDKKLLTRPTFYISEYLEDHRDVYYEKLLAVSRDDDWTGWCVFFLKALTAQANDNTSKAQSILKLYEEKKGWIAERTHSQYAIHALDFIFARPIFRSIDFVNNAGIPEPTARRIIQLLREEDDALLGELRAASGRRSAVLCCPDLLNAAEGRKVF